MPTPIQQRLHLPSHAVLRSFECAARQQSFTLASEELGLTQSAVSRQVKELEQIIGTDLFRRVGRGVVLTDAGRNLAVDLAIDLENIRQTVVRAIASGDQGTVLRIAVLPTFASRWLIPRLADFAERAPNVTVNLATRLEPFDLAKERFDIAIHFGAENWPGTKMTRIFEEDMIAVCAPSFATRHKIAQSAEMTDLPLLHLETRPMAWSDFFVQLGVADSGNLSGMYFDQFSMLIAAAVASLGVALIPQYLIESELSDGRLVQLGDARLRTKNAYFVVTSAGANRPGVGLFTNWIRSAVQAP
ncbi:MAG: LysR family transcriptional regulator [Paracoccaceae bacterium]